MIISKYGLQLAKTTLQKEQIIKIYLTLSLSYRKEGVYDTAMVYIDSAKAYAFENKIESEYGNVYDREGLVYMRMADYEKATQSFYKSISYFEKANDSLKLPSVFGHLGSVSFYRYDYKAAIKFYKKGLSFIVRLKTKNYMPPRWITSDSAFRI